MKRLYLVLGFFLAMIFIGLAVYQNYFNADPYEKNREIFRERLDDPQEQEFRLALYRLYFQEHIHWDCVDKIVNRHDKHYVTDAMILGNSGQRLTAFKVIAENHAENCLNWNDARYDFSRRNIVKFYQLN